MLRVCLIATVAVLLPATAAGAATWSGTEQPRGCPADFGFSTAGHGLAVIGTSGSIGQLSQPARVNGSWAPLSPNGQYGTVGKLPFEPTGMALYGAGRFAATGYLGRRGTLQSPYREYALFGSIAKGPGKPRMLGTQRYTSIDALHVTVSSSGRAVAMFGGTRKRHGKTLSELRLASNGFRRTTVVARGRNVGNGALAGNKRGEVLVAWRSGASVYARLRTPDGKLLKSQRLGATKHITTISVALDDAGHGVVAWAGVSAANHQLTGPRTVLAAFRRPHGRFAAARVLETIVHPSPLPDYAGVHAGFAGDRLLLAWTGSDGQRTLVRAEIDEDDGAVIARGTVDQADPNAYLTGLAVDRSGMAAVAWTKLPDLTPYASVLPPGSESFGDPERIGDSNANDAARLAIDPISRTILAVGPSSPVGCWFSARTPD